MRDFLRQTQIETFPEPIDGIIEQTISVRQCGRVQCRGTSWPAKFYQGDRPEQKAIDLSLLPDSPVKVVARQGITMLVKPFGG